MISTRSARTLAGIGLGLALTGCSTAPVSAPSTDPMPTPAYQLRDGLPWIPPIEFDHAEGVAHPGYWEPVGVDASTGATQYRSAHVEGCTLAIASSPASMVGGTIQAGADRASTVNVLAGLSGSDTADVKGGWKLSSIRYGNDPEHVGRVDVLETHGTDERGAYRSVARVLADVDLFIRFQIECADQSALQTATGLDNASLAIATR